MPFWKYAEVIKKKLGRYIFHRYFKQYVKGKLSPAQFSFELHKGKITITDVCLDVKVIGSCSFVCLLELNHILLRGKMSCLAYITLQPENPRACCHADRSTYCSA